MSVSLDQFPYRHPPFKHQRDVFEKTATKPAWAYFMEMGTGKSKILTDTFSFLFLNGEIDTVVIMAKKGEYANWIYDQLPTHVPEGVDWEGYLFATAKFKTSAGKREFDRIFSKSFQGLRVFVINVESLITDSGFQALKQVYANSAKGVFLGIDESTCVKHHDSKRSKQAYLWASKSKYRRIMTGTPVTQSPLDLWGQCMALGRGLLGHGSFFSFRGEYAEMETMYLGPRAIKKITGFRNLDKLGRVVDSFSSQILKKDCLDLPDKIYTKRVIPLSKAQEKLYNQLRDEAMIDHEGVELEVTHVLTQIVKLHQISCGQLKTEDGKYHSIENDRLPALVELLEDYNGKAIIWANYRQTLTDVVDKLKEVFGEEAVAAYYGGVSDADRVSAVKRFQDPDDPLRFFVANPQSAGYGLTLTRARLVVYYSNGYNLEHRLQSEDRAHRIGQTENVTYVDFVSPGTVDERILKVLREKKNLADEVMRNKDLGAWI
jgi:hypothetical protein